MKWFDRSFSFAFPVDIHPCVVERLHGLLPRVHHFAATVGAEQWTRVEGAAWSAQRNIGHLADLDELFRQRIEDLLAGLPELRPADLENRRTDLADHDAQPFDAVVARLATNRSALLQRVVGLPTEAFARSALHPRLSTPMRLVDLLYFVAEHDDHHLVRMRTLLHG